MEAIPTHRHIVKYIDSFLTGTKFNIVMEYCEKGDLSDYIRRASAPQFKMDIPEWKIWRFFIQICLALDHLHQLRIVHSDLKPSNVFMAGKDCSVKLGDFGTS